MHGTLNSAAACVTPADFWRRLSRQLTSPGAGAKRFSVRDLLLSWFRTHQRTLPWRGLRDPYAVWVSEVMLQQTQVSTVIPYFERFMRRFPTVRSLASAQLDEVLGLWTGLGYYSRARQLHRAAQQVVSEHMGELPTTAAELMELPGFGRYTAGAVASIAFGEEAPIVDGNVARVLSRLNAWDAPPGDKAREARLWEEAAALARGPTPGTLNEALMELGATVCLPRHPHCAQCPLAARCRALASNRVDAIPPPRPRAPRKRLELAVGICRRDDRLLMVRRIDRGLFGGLWELPAAASPAALRRLLGRAVNKPIATVRRTLTHRDLVLTLYQVWSPSTRRLAGSSAAPKGRTGTPPYSEHRWITRPEAAPLGISAATQEVLRVAWGKTEPSPPPRSLRSKRRATQV